MPKLLKENLAEHKEYKPVNVRKDKWEVWAKDSGALAAERGGRRSIPQYLYEATEFFEKYRKENK